MAVDLLHSLTLMHTSRIQAPTPRAYPVSESMMMRIERNTVLLTFNWSLSIVGQAVNATSIQVHCERILWVSREHTIASMSNRGRR